MQLKIMMQNQNLLYGTSDAVLTASVKKDGLIWRTETGSTPLKLS